MNCYGQKRERLYSVKDFQLKLTDYVGIHLTLRNQGGGCAWGLKGSASHFVSREWLLLQIR